MTKAHWKALLGSTGRTLLATLITAVGIVYVALPDSQKDFSTWDQTQFQAFGLAVLGTLVKIGIDWFRAGNTAFGRGATTPLDGPDGGEGA